MVDLNLIPCQIFRLYGMLTSNNFCAISGKGHHLLHYETFELEHNFSLVY